MIIWWLCTVLTTVNAFLYQILMDILTTPINSSGISNTEKSIRVWELGECMQVHKCLNTICKEEKELCRFFIDTTGTPEGIFIFCWSNQNVVVKWEILDTINSINSIPVVAYSYVLQRPHLPWVISLQRHWSIMFRGLNTWVKCTPVSPLAVIKIILAVNYLLNSNHPSQWS